MKKCNNSDSKTHLLINRPDINIRCMLLGEQDKEALVTDLLNKGYNTREIAKMAHISFSYIKKIRQKLTGEVNEEKDDPKNKTLSINSRAFKLFLEGKTLVDVAIELDSPRQEVIEIFNDFLRLQNMAKAVAVLKEHQNQLAPFVKLLEELKRNNTRVKDIKYAMNNINNIKALEERKNKLKEEVH